MYLTQHMMLLINVHTRTYEITIVGKKTSFILKQFQCKIASKATFFKQNYSKPNSDGKIVKTLLNSYELTLSTIGSFLLNFVKIELQPCELKIFSYILCVHL